MNQQQKIIDFDHTQYSHSIIYASTSEGRTILSPTSLSGPSANRVWVDNPAACCNEELVEEEDIGAR